VNGYKTILGRKAPGKVGIKKIVEKSVRN
jgi:hypothetical protein